ncbi:MAG: MFS transporter [Lachnospiraceae bacterium]|nr:MFS transporter [Lachnospiraceae bacterium]
MRLSGRSFLKKTKEGTEKDPKKDTKKMVERSMHESMEKTIGKTTKNFVKNSAENSTKNSAENCTNSLLCVILVIAACLVHGVMQGVHDNYGIMMQGLVRTTEISYAYISFCIGVGALVYGIAQPFLGMLALRKSNAFVILMGIALTVAGLIITPLCRKPLSMLLFFGILLPLGTTGLCFGIVMGAITPFLTEKRAALVSGIVQASAGVGDALMSPALQRMSDDFGIRIAMSVTALPFLIMIPIVLWMGRVNKARKAADENGTGAAEEASSEKTDAITDENSRIVPAKHAGKISNDRESRISDEYLSENTGENTGKNTSRIADENTGGKLSLTAILRDAFRVRDYRLILIGFATCGFNMSIIESHLYSQYISYGIDSSAASLTLTVYGLATMTGAVLSGYLGTKFRMKNVLGTLYAMRVVISLSFLLVPKTAAFAFVAAALLGMCGDATVPPTSGIISKRFGAEKMAVLYGFALIGHQVGAFLSSFLGGLFVKNGMGYEPLWVVNLCLAAIAAAASYRIREEHK